MGERYFDLTSMYVAGTSHYMSKEQVEHECPVGARLFLVREKDNAHDANAIRVERMVGTVLLKCGYVPRVLASLVSTIIDNGYDLHGVVEYADERKREVLFTIRMSVRER